MSPYWHFRYCVNRRNVNIFQLIYTYITLFGASVWDSYQIFNIAGCTCVRNAGNVFPPPRVSNPDMHHLVRGPWLGTSFYWYPSGVFHWCWGYTERCGYNAVNFLSKLKIYTPYGVSFVSTISDLYSGSVTVVLYTISCGIGPRYNGKRLYSVTWLSE